MPNIYQQLINFEESVNSFIQKTNDCLDDPDFHLSLTEKPCERSAQEAKILQERDAILNQFYTLHRSFKKLPKLIQKTNPEIPKRYSNALFSFSEPCKGLNMAQLDEINVRMSRLFGYSS